MLGQMCLFTAPKPSWESPWPLLTSQHHLHNSFQAILYLQLKLQIKPLNWNIWTHRKCYSPKVVYFLHCIWEIKRGCTRERGPQMGPNTHPQGLSSCLSCTGGQLRPCRTGLDLHYNSNDSFKIKIFSLNSSCFLIKAHCCHKLVKTELEAKPSDRAQWKLSSLVHNPKS